MPFPDGEQAEERQGCLDHVAFTFVHDLKGPSTPFSPEETSLFL